MARCPSQDWDKYCKETDIPEECPVCAEPYCTPDMHEKPFPQVGEACQEHMCIVVDCQVAPFCCKEHQDKYLSDQDAADKAIAESAGDYYRADPDPARQARLREAAADYYRWVADRMEHDELFNITDGAMWGMIAIAEDLVNNHYHTPQQAWEVIHDAYVKMGKELKDNFDFRFEEKK